MANAISYSYNIVDRMSSAFQRMSRSSNRFTRGLNADFQRAQQRVSRFTSNLRTGFNTAMRVGAVAAVGAATGAVAMFIREASKIEDVTAAFTPLMGSAEKATELVDALNQTAASTPFQFENIASASQQLLPVMNQDIERTVETFRMLGDTAGGNAQKLDSITRGFTKAMLKGKVDMESLNMIAEAGVPIFDQLSGELGVSTERMFEMISAGEVTTDALTNTFQTMTSEGGIFFNGMEIASQTLTGRFSTLKDNIALTAASIGQTMLPIVKGFIDKAIEVAMRVKSWVEQNRELIQQGFQRIVSVGAQVFSTLGQIWQVITKVFNIVKPFLPIIIGMVAAFKAYQIILTIAAVAQAAFNAIMAINPVTLVVLAVGALIGLFVMLVKRMGGIKEAFMALGQTIMKALFTPINLIIDGLQMFVGMLANLPGKAGEAFANVNDKIQEFQEGMNLTMTGSEGAYDFGAAFTPEGAQMAETPQNPPMAVNAEASVSVFTERGIGVQPFERRGNLGYNMNESRSQ